MGTSPYTCRLSTFCRLKLQKQESLRIFLFETRSRTTFFWLYLETSDIQEIASITNAQAHFPQGILSLLCNLNFCTRFSDVDSKETYRQTLTGDLQTWTAATMVGREGRIAYRSGTLWASSTGYDLPTERNTTSTEWIIILSQHECAISATTLQTYQRYRKRQLLQITEAKVRLKNCKYGMGVCQLNTT